MSAESIIEGLQDVETALEKLAKRCNVTSQVQFSRGQDVLRFKARKQEYKALLRDAQRWLRNHGLDLEEQEDLERGFYDEHDGLYFHDTEADNPFRWAMQAASVRQELRKALDNLPVSSAAPNLYLINCL